MGNLATAFRMPFGVLALAAGFLTDRIGARRMMVTYLVGCGAASLVVSQVTSLSGMFVALFALGSFASIYHPAGLALISHETSVENRARALGMHGIFGSL